MAAAENSANVVCSESEDSSKQFVDNFKGATSEVLDRFLKYIKFEDFAAKYYPEIYKSDPEFLKDIYNQFLSQLRDQIRVDLDVFCNDQQLFPKLEEFNNLAKEASQSEDVKAWRPSGDPNEDIRDHKWRIKVIHKKALESLLQNIRSQNEQLEKEVMDTHEEINMLKENIIKQDKQNTADISAFEDNLNMIETIEPMADDG